MFNEVLSSVARADRHEANPSKRWRRARFSAIAHLRSSVGLRELPLLSVYLGRGVIPYSEGGKRVHAPSEDLGLYQEVRPGDFVMNNQQAWRGSVGVSAHQGIVSPAYRVFELSPELSPAFARHYLASPSMVDQYVLASKGVGDIQRTLYLPYLKERTVVVPPKDEQAAIVKYLGHAHARIDRAIAAKRKLIALLEEQKQAIIHQAVTRGLDPTVPLKDSGISWLGEIPAHWSVARLKDLAEVQTGLTLGKDYGAVQTSEYNYLRVANVQSSSLDLREITRVRVTASEAERCTLRTGDVLMTEGGDIDKLGRSTIWTGEIEPCLHQNHVFAVRCHWVLDPRYLVLMMSTPHGRQYFYTTAKKTTNLASTNSTTLRAFGFPYPAVDEQRRIVAWLEDNTAGVVGVQSRANREIDLLREFRTRLTSDVVTGQVDVREIAATLPDLPDELLARTGNDAGYTEVEPAEDSSSEFVG